MHRIENGRYRKSIQRIGDQAFNTRSSWDQMTLEKITVLFDDIASGSSWCWRAVREASRNPAVGDLVSYKIYRTEGTKSRISEELGRIIVR